MEKKITKDNQAMDRLFLKVADLVEQARKHVATAVNVAEVYTKYHIGQYIVEYEQDGETRAEYGKAVLKELSKRLTDRFGDGWSYPTLKNIRQFFIVYSNLINTVYQIEQGKSTTVQSITSKNKKAKQWLANSEPTFSLSWSHYLILMRVENPDARHFYEIECTEQQWSVRQLSRQVGSSLYERLALSRNKEEVMRLAREGQNIVTG